MNASMPESRLEDLDPDLNYAVQRALNALDEALGRHPKPLQLHEASCSACKIAMVFATVAEAEAFKRTHFQKWYHRVVILPRITPMQEVQA